MDVILQQKVGGLGNLGDKVSVKPGYGRNFLIPTGRAVAATEANIAAFEARRAELEKVEAEALASAEARRDKLADMGVEIRSKAGAEGKLFGSVGNVDIAAALSEAGIEVAKSEVRLPEGPIRAAGEYEVAVHLHSDIDATVKVTVIGED